MAQVTARYGRRAGDGSARFTLISPCYYAGSSCRSRSWARCRWFTVLLLLLLLPLLPPPPPLPPLLQGLARGLCRWLGSLQGASARGGEAEGDQGSRRQQDRSASPPRCDMRCAAWPHVHDSPATEADLETLARHAEYLEWRKASPSTACRAGDGPARFALRSLC